jgi:hypothetical protein
MAEPDSKQRNPPGTRRRSIEEQLDEALADSFPASDPVSLVTSQMEEDWADSSEAGNVDSGGKNAGDGPKATGP